MCWKYLESLHWMIPAHFQIYKRSLEMFSHIGMAIAGMRILSTANYFRAFTMLL